MNSTSGYSIGAYNTYSDYLGKYTYWNPSSSRYMDADLTKLAGAGGKAPYTATVSARLNIALPPVRPVVAMYTYKDARYGQPGDSHSSM